MRRETTGPGGVRICNAIPVEQKGAANGVATLDGDGLVPEEQLPSLDFIPTSEKGAADGVATLDGDGKVPEAQLPMVQFVAKGDLLTFDGADAVRLPPGSDDGMVLVRRTSASAGIAWEAPVTQLNNEGSIFSMKNPLGLPDALVAYDFTRFDPALTLAQNLQAANVSAVAAFHLGAVNSPTYDFAAKTSLLGPRPKLASVQGGGLVTSDATPDTVITSLGADNTLRVVGEMTAEVLVTVLAMPASNAQEAVLLSMTAAGETEDTNGLFVFRIAVATGPIYVLAYFAEHGAGVNITANLCQIPSPVGAGPTYLAFTRDATGKVTGYINGARVSALVTPTDAGGGGIILPGRGANPTQNLIIGGNATMGLRALWHAVKISGSCFTDAQIQESFNRSMYGVGVSLV